MRHIGSIAVALILILMIAAVAGGCGSDPEEDEIKQVLEDQIEFLRNEDLEGVLSTMHPESPQYTQSRSVVEQAFELYDLEYEIESIEVIEKGENEARVRAVQITRRVSGPELADTKVVAIHTIRKTEGGWKLYESVAQSSEKLDAGGE